MNEAKLHPELYGLVELNQEGTVLYSRLDDAGASSDINGRNFFSEVAPFKNVEAFRQLVSNFTSGRDQANNFNFMCDFDDMTVERRPYPASGANLGEHRRYGDEQGRRLIGRH